MRKTWQMVALTAAVAALSAPAGAQLGGTPAISPEMILGHWSDDGDCSRGVLIRADGTFLSYDDGVEGVWELDGDRFRVNGFGGSFEARLLAVEAETMTVSNEDGSVGLSIRCPDDEPGELPDLAPETMSIA